MTVTRREEPETTHPEPDDPPWAIVCNAQLLPGSGTTPPPRQVHSKQLGLLNRGLLRGAAQVDVPRDPARHQGRLPWLKTDEA